MWYLVRSQVRYGFLVIMALVLSACGGSGSTNMVTPQPTLTQTAVVPTPTIPPTPTNNPPKIVNVTASPAQICPGQGTSLIAIVTDPDGDPITYSWVPTLGTVSNEKTTPSGSMADYQASAVPGADVVNLTVLDGRGGADSKQINVVVRDDCPIVVKITSPSDSLSCPVLENGACLIEVKGTTAAVTSRNDFNDLRLYVLVFPQNPAGAGWYIQLQPGFIQSDGSWTQSPSWLGNQKVHAQAGHTLKIIAIVVPKDAKADTITGTRPISSMQGQNNDNVVRDPKAITPLLGISDVVNLTVAPNP